MILDHIPTFILQQILYIINIERIFQIQYNSGSIFICSLTTRKLCLFKFLIFNLVPILCILQYSKILSIK